MDWINDLISKERGHEDEICDTGKAELQGIAHRMRDRLHMDKDMSGDIIIENTYKKRTIQSRDIFLCTSISPSLIHSIFLTLIFPSISHSLQASLSL